jgi:hypothetical protein
LAIQLAVRGPLEKRSAEEPVLSVEKRETADEFFELIPFILRIDVETSLETPRNHTIPFGICGNAFAEFRRQGDPPFIVNSVCKPAFERGH